MQMFDFRNLKLQFRRGGSATETLLLTWGMDNVNAAALRDALFEARLIRAANIVQRYLGGEQVPVLILPLMLHIATHVSNCHSDKLPSDIIC